MSPRTASLQAPVLRPLSPGDILSVMFPKEKLLPVRLGLNWAEQPLKHAHRGCLWLINGL